MSGLLCDPMMEKTGAKVFLSSVCIRLSIESKMCYNDILSSDDMLVIDMID